MSPRGFRNLKANRRDMMKSNKKTSLIALIRNLIERWRLRREKDYKEFAAFWAEKYNSRVEEKD
jgi:hypothetical protein